jgi:putative addiction module component (TIGR02574 family)
MDMTTALQEIARWPVEDKFELVHRILDQLAESEGPIELTPEVKAELERRLAAAAANPSDVITWDSIVEYVRRKR